SANIHSDFPPTQNFSLYPSSLIVLYTDDLYEEGGQLFCRICCHTIDHVRKYTIDECMKSRKYCERKAMAIKKAKSFLSTHSLLSTALFMERKELVLDFVQYLTRADTLLEKAPAFQEFLRKYTKQGGTIPTQSQLCYVYLKEKLEILICLQTVLKLHFCIF
uniref:Uncharacterized protein n=1 Tax=Callorhinchus milii TaxID=7868 RepID=A0A4W3J7V7_CALMI